tara:strand:- start:1452 stop:1745 length:294 start_codon:yes stop_codon:yes gene_type:complete
MTNKIRKKAHSAGFKFKVALAAIKGDKTVSELCQDYGVVSRQIFKWKKALLENGAAVFNNAHLQKVHPDREVEKLHAAIGRLKVENDFLSKFAGVDQ